MGDPTGVAAIRKTLKEKIKPAVGKAVAESDKLWSLLADIDKSVEKSIADADVERMELHEAAYRVCEKRAAVLLTVVDTLLRRLDELAENPDFVEELSTFNNLTETLGGIKTQQRNGLTDSRSRIAEMHKARQLVRNVSGDVAQQWSVAEAQVAAAGKEAAAALVAMKVLRQKAAKAVKDGDAKALAQIQAQSKAFKAPLGQAAVAKLSQLAAKTLLFINKSAIDKDEAELYERDGKKLTDTVNAAAANVAEVLFLQVEIDKMQISVDAIGAVIAKAMKIGKQDATRLGKVAQDNPGKLAAEIEATIKRLKLDLVAKDIYTALKRVGVV